MTMSDPMTAAAHQPHCVVGERVSEEVSGCPVGCGTRPSLRPVPSLVCASRADRVFTVVERSTALANHLLLSSGQRDMASPLREWSGRRWVVTKGLGTIASTVGSSSAPVPGTETRPKGIGWRQPWGAVPGEVGSIQADGPGTVRSPQCRSARPAERGEATRVSSSAGVVQAGGAPLARLTLSRRPIPNQRCRSLAKSSWSGSP
jgi:hypothetical protein